MSTQRELLAQGVLRMRKATWAAPEDHLEYESAESMIGPWAILWSPMWLEIANHLSDREANAAALKHYRQTVLVMQADDGESDWEAYDGPRQRVLLPF